MGIFSRAGTLSLAGVLVAGNALAAASSKCAKPDEVTAIQTAAVQQELMVAALTCNDVASFNAFQIGFGPELRTSDATLHGMFKRVFGARRGEDEFHAFKTRLANDSSIRSIHDNAGYCQEAGNAFAAALTPAKPTLAVFVSGVTVQEQSPVDSCQVRVAVSLGGAGSAFILPKPKPFTGDEVPASPVTTAVVAPMAAPASSSAATGQAQ